METPVANATEEEHDISVHHDAPEKWLEMAVRAMQRQHSSFLIGPVDMSCAFSVSDARRPDMPLIYASPAFERMTQYSLGEVRGRNHRFMQDPKGEQAAGVYRMHTDNEAVLSMMQSLSIGQESQVTLSNYLKSSKRWTNLLTMIPIVSKHSSTFDFVVALQINADNFPDNITRHADGIFEVDYRLDKKIPRPLKPAPTRAGPLPLAIDELLSQYSKDRRLWGRYLLREMKDVVFAFSSQGMVRYVSSAISTLLGYRPREVIGQHISYLVHPADLSYLTRKLENASPHDPLNLLARFRHGDRSFRWIELAGQCLYDVTAQGTRCIVASARPRRTLSPDDYGGFLRPNEFWSRTSPDGMILFSTASASKLLGIPQAQLLGARLSDIVDEIDHDTLTQALQLARTGQAGCIRHSCVQKYPQYGRRIPCVSYFYPGTNHDDLLPDFLLVRTCMMIEPGTVHLPGDKLVITPSTSPSPSLLSDSGATESGVDQISLEPVPMVDLLADLGSSMKTSWQTELSRARKQNKILRDRLEFVRNNQPGTATTTTTTPVVRSTDGAVLCCNVCGTTETTQWRTGVQGVRLCNSCGLSWRKRTR